MKFSIMALNLEQLLLDIFIIRYYIDFICIKITI